MTMDFKRLRTFEAAAQFQSFSEASNQLGYVQSAVTTQIRSLEEELETQLFVRNGRGVALTPAGEKLQEYTQKLFGLRAEAREAVKSASAEAGIIRIAGYETILTYLLPQLIHNYSRTHPKVQLHIQPIGVRQLRQMVNAEVVDMAFIFEDASSKQASTGLQRKILGQEDVIVVAAPTHALAKQSTVHAADLTGETLLLTERGCYYRNQFESALIQAGALTGTVLEFTSIEAIKSCVKLGTGIAAISKVSVEKDLQKGEICQLNWQDTPLSVDISLVWKDKAQPTAVQRFMEMVEFDLRPLFHQKLIG